MAQQKIQSVKTTLWNKYIVSFNANPDFNIIVGNNGSGKTTLLNNLYQVIADNVTDPNQIVFLPSMDNIATRDKRRSTTALAQDLDYYLYDTKTGPSLTQYRMNMIDASLEEIQQMKGRIELLLSSVNQLFAVTDKRLVIKDNKYYLLHHDKELSVDALSSGEKQVLLLLLRTFLSFTSTSSVQAFILIDEPETSLDLEWQLELLNIFHSLQPEAQYFITTHSPGIFGDGWGDKVIYMDQVTKPIEQE